MTKIIGVRFRNAGKVYYFDPQELDLKRGDRVIVETARGVECGKVVLSVREVPDDKVVQPLRPVIRIADEKDIEKETINLEKEKEAYRVCKQKIREHNLDMKLVQAEYTFDNKKVLFYFTADGRVDFRELVKDLASVFKTRIELRQIGVRDETKLIGGIGICGRELCCATYLSDFAPVSIRMAKEQNLSLNPTKISGVCGRLMCCLKNEEEAYEYLNKNLPGVGDIVETPEGSTGIVQTVNVLRQRVRVLTEEGDEKTIEDYPAEEITVVQKRRKGVKPQLPPQKKEEAKNEDVKKRPAEKDNKGEKRVHSEEEAEASDQGKNGERKSRNENRRRRDRSRNAEGSAEVSQTKEHENLPSHPVKENKPEEVVEAVYDGAEDGAEDEARPQGEKRRRRRRRRRGKGQGQNAEQAGGSEE